MTIQIPGPGSYIEVAGVACPACLELVEGSLPAVSLSN